MRLLVESKSFSQFFLNISANLRNAAANNKYGFASSKDIFLLGLRVFEIILDMLSKDSHSTLAPDPVTHRRKFG